MSTTSRELVFKALHFDHPERIPRDLWILPWVEMHYPKQLKHIQKKFPSDFGYAGYSFPPSSKRTGDPFKKGTYIDDWGCVFKNIHDGIIGEVKDPLIQSMDDWNAFQPPLDSIPSDGTKPRAIIRTIHENSTQFILAGCCPRPWERYQFLRGTTNAYMDIMQPDKGFLGLLERIHQHYLRELEFWVKTEVDGIMFMDDWGTQTSLLINPVHWREYFKPLYKEYCALIHAYDKPVFMHSDGCIFDIIGDLIEVGVNALNSQIFCMDLQALQNTYKGNICFWGEIDRQHILPSEDPQQGRDAVNQVASTLFDPSGGIIAQLEFGVGANPDTVEAVFDEWDQISLGKKK